ncbi:uncharacterized protein BO66DRAFT_393764 [Aspergillus aculeatinus CBS 121060]|uniref:CHCH domain-containing protein n=4 Tax=Aspergillus TaxID=5052 RepID=A0A1L9X5P6_ASPA1|nr:uncharacterized protein ASPACDRAFT_75165 [Aspergillus aculeatus ATCC 16872]XP_025443612.1 hypothetical protein BO95DRAFT_359680 [Aspergillus brunneoviolaceus CBS 621.78]XP_025501367.1 hypothetical protein BO66DRAFT_393764 [Aspergillus aculeatinus CBS 121060]XP_040805917.1 uncharacterized protein BO72DRAFT_444382 [Aspergillus fijiensis CBS 313.89]OJK03628.1 hypothetical protein ASPACDRAFT_75165 [Aspergillus aculeatus ATCC 16872]RAH47091.1 hypothetical protein BO95DRAFT_359680 [Aspergillus br
MTNKEERQNPPVENAAEDDDEPDEWEKRINRTGCADEQMTLNDCVYQKKDWRSCQKEMEAFRECWKQQGNDQRTQTQDA